MERKPSEQSLVSPVVLDWQKNTVRQLVELKQHQTLPHALLIALNTAVDSREFGWYMALALLCEAPEDALPCGKCHACRLMKANNYPDFTYTTLIADEKTHKLNKVIKINQIRRLIHQLSLTQNLKGGKFALIYPAEKMNIPAANSLLKTLEEPSSDSTLILLSHNPGKLPVTIRSRCQKWTLDNPSPAIAQSWLAETMQADQVEDYLAMAQGDAQLALQLHAQGFKHKQEAFDASLEKLLSGEKDAASSVKALKSMPGEDLRILLKNSLHARIHALIRQKLTLSSRTRLQKLLNLNQYAEKVLQTEDNNLNLQLQLEDVLISLRQIINTRG
jgi:DNA polymerase-3 subunit delta'